MRSLPVAEPKQLYLLTEVSSRETGPARLSWPGTQSLRNSLPPGAQIAVLTDAERFDLTHDAAASQAVSGQLVSGNYFDVLGVHPQLGRLIADADHRAPGESPVAALSNAAWANRFGRDPHVLGRTMHLNGAPLVVVGVAPPSFFGVSLGAAPDVWLPLMMQHEVRYARKVASHNGDTRKPWPMQENLYWLNAVVRVAPPASISASTSALNAAYAPEQDLGARVSGIPKTGGSY